MVKRVKHGQFLDLTRHVTEQPHAEVGGVVCCWPLTWKKSSIRLENSELQTFIGPVLPLSGPNLLECGSKR